MNRSVEIILQVSYWLVYAILLAFIFHLLEANQKDQSHQFEHCLKLISLAIIPALINFYVSYFILFEKFLKAKRFFILTFIIIFVAYLTTSIGGIILKFSLGYNIFFDEGVLTSIPLTFIVSSIPIVHGIFGIGMKAFILWFEEVKMKEMLMEKNFETELALVKSQISPHFLFNTLNNIDTLIDLDSEKASQYLNKLSDIMRFMLYESKTEKIPVEKELYYIEKYIDLQKIRTTNNKFASLNITGDASSITVEPMLFIPFIENAFKYAENNEEDNAITINFLFETGAIKFACENKYQSIPVENTEQGGLGNSLIKKRLTLLFPNNHHLEIENANGIYKVNLNITLYEN